MEAADNINVVTGTSKTVLNSDGSVSAQAVDAPEAAPVANEPAPTVTRTRTVLKYVTETVRVRGRNVKRTYPKYVTETYTVPAPRTAPAPKKAAPVLDGTSCSAPCVPAASAYTVPTKKARKNCAAL
uniref:Uncharacterized protein n=1 Tax=Conchiformibius kuhniae TaxID=211502 RepID=A0A8T9MZR5_9NEIS|nr:hypothetical protein LVJ77_03415 [Conchiformibius kuhniae]